MTSPPASLLRQHTAFLPDFCTVRMAIAVILIAQLLAIVLTLVTPGLRLQGLQALALNSLFIQWVALSCVALLCLLRRWLNRLPDVWSALLSYLLMLGVTWIVTEIAWWILYTLPDTGLGASPDHATVLLRNLGISGIVSALVLRYFYVQHQWRRHVQSEAQARLQALQARIRPHFLFNCMNTIASLIRRQPGQAEQAVEDLADLFRLSLHDSSEWTLAEELDLCRRYLRIEQLRLGERLQVQWDTDALPGDARLPALSLQPLLENAVYHGIEPRPDGGCMRISGRRAGKRLHISIQNPLPPAGTGGMYSGNRLAQDNVRQRLGGFDEDAGLNVDVDTDRYRVDIELAYRTTPCAS